MLAVLHEVLVVFLLIIGVFFFFGTTVGIIRFPDFYSRMHAAGKGDTLSSFLLLLGLGLYNLHDFSVATLLVLAKILFISVFIFIASPTATHAIMDAGYEAKVKPWTRRQTEDGSHAGPERREKEERHD
jgi:multicomponent Na+:H+ antiporter subunit G